MDLILILLQVQKNFPFLICRIRISQTKIQLIFQAQTESKIFSINSGPRETKKVMTEQGLDVHAATHVAHMAGMIRGAIQCCLDIQLKL